MVHVSFSTTTDVIISLVGTGFVHCSLRDDIAVMCASRLSGFDPRGIDVASTTALCITVSRRAVKEPSRAVVDVRRLSMLHHLDLQLGLHGQFHRRHSCMKTMSHDVHSSVM